MASSTWHYTDPVDGILDVLIKQPDRSVNSLGRAALAELDELISRASTDAAIRAIVFRSGKPGNFIAGADVLELMRLSGAAEARDISEFGQRVFSRLAELRVPTLALISGSCLGGGLEFALSCRYRIADDHPKTLLGLPEVKLGLIPGWGGTVRLPKQIGLTAALSMILTGRMLNPYQARRRGLVDDVVPNEAFPTVPQMLLGPLVRQDTSSANARSRGVGRHRPRWRRLLFDNRWFAKLALSQAERMVRRDTHGHYPAPLAAIEALRTQFAGTATDGFTAETAAVAQLAEHPVTTELMRLFFLSEETKKPPDWLEAEVDPQAIENAAVVGAGGMGAGIALLMARRGIWTRLKDLSPELVSRGLKVVHKLLNADRKRRRLQPRDMTRALDHLRPTTDYSGFGRSDIVIEAVVENLNVKRQVFQELAEVTGPETVLATNTSSLLLAEIAGEVPHPERVVGLHFFNPPHRMALVEVVRLEQTSPKAVATALAVVKRLSKTPILVGDCAGFLVNRLLAPYLNEAGYLLAELPDPLEMERAALEFGMPMGPLELIGLVGIDVATHVSENMRHSYGERMAPAPLWQKLRELQQSRGQAPLALIRKTRRGMHLDSRVAKALGEMSPPPSARSEASLPWETIIKRLIYPLINEAARCLDENIVERAEDVDLAMVLGTGFAPFRGGPLRYADAVGIAEIVQALDAFAVEHPRLAPSEALRRRADEHARFLEPFEERFSPSVA